MSWLRMCNKMLDNFKGEEEMIEHNCDTGSDFCIYCFADRAYQVFKEHAQIKEIKYFWAIENLELRKRVKELEEKLKNE